MATRPLQELSDEWERRVKTKVEAAIVEGYNKGLRDGAVAIVSLLLERDLVAWEQEEAVEKLLDEIKAGRV